MTFQVEESPEFGDSRPQLTDEQQRCKTGMLEKTANGQQVVLGSGLAGTGKSTVLGDLARTLPRTHLCAFTGKAASVVKQKTGLPATTCHSLFYQLVEKIVDEKTGKKELIFQRVRGDDSMVGENVLLDESSMIPEKMANDLIRSGATIYAFGDHGQLPPVRGNAFFTQPDFVLETIHRQALDSAIIRQAYAMRNTGSYQDDGDDFKVVSRTTNAQLEAADVILCHRNATRHKLNAKMRGLLGYDAFYPQAGERVVCLKNYHEYGIFNGQQFTLTRPFEPEDKSIYLMHHGHELRIPNAIFVEEGGSIDDYDDDDFSTAFDYGYALTVHKAQGSEWDKVVLIDENKKWDRRKWCYTAITRAAKSIIIQGK